MFEHHELNRALWALDAGFRRRPCVLHEQPAVPLTLIVIDDETTEIRVSYDRRRFRPEVATRIAWSLARALERLPQARLVADVDVPPAALGDSRAHV